MDSSKNQFAEAELRFSFTPPQNPTKVMCSKQLEPFLYEIWDKELINFQEQFYVLYLNNALEIVCWRCLHTGMMTSTVIDLRLLFGFAFGCGATSIIIAHNHPSGQLVPSECDKSITHKIKQAGELLEIRLLDHVILAGGKSFSFCDAGWYRGRCKMEDGKWNPDSYRVRCL